MKDTIRLIVIKRRLIIMNKMIFTNKMTAFLMVAIAMLMLFIPGINTNATERKCSTCNIKELLTLNLNHMMRWKFNYSVR